jgi:DNA-binding transcriptional regulator YiaG
MPGHAYVGKLPNGRYFAVELPEGAAEYDASTGELILQPPAIHLLDRLQVLLSPLPPTTTANRLRLLREMLGMSLDQFAGALHLTRNLIEDWEAGRCAPSAAHLAALEQLRQHALRTGVTLPELATAS